jgi:hypothetical protein
MLVRTPVVAATTCEYTILSSPLISLSFLTGGVLGVMILFSYLGQLHVASHDEPLNWRPDTQNDLLAGQISTTAEDHETEAKSPIL